MHVRERLQFVSRFPTDDNLLLSGDIRDQVKKLSEIAPKCSCFGVRQFLTQFYKYGSPPNLWWLKFGDNRPRDLRD